MNSVSNNRVNLKIVSDVERKYKIDLRERILQFAVQTLQFLMKVDESSEIKVLKYQLSKAATSIGANYEEAQSTTRKEFIHRVRVALREANECKYWLKIIDELGIDDSVERMHLHKEAEEISLILGSIASKMDKIS